MTKKVVKKTVEKPEYEFGGTLFGKKLHCEKDMFFGPKDIAEMITEIHSLQDKLALLSVEKLQLQKTQKSLSDDIKYLEEAHEAYVKYSSEEFRRCIDIEKNTWDYKHKPIVAALKERIGVLETEAKIERSVFALNLLKSFALISFGMTLGALIWMWL